MSPEIRAFALPLNSTVAAGAARSPAVSSTTATFARRGATVPASLPPRP